MRKVIVCCMVLITLFVFGGCAKKMSITQHVQKEKQQTTEEQKQTEEKKQPKKTPQTTVPGVPAQPKPENKLIPYNGPVEHIFFHPLVVYPQLAFDGDSLSKGYDEYFVTIKEFNQMIQSIYEKNYILIKISDLFEEKEVNGKTILFKKNLLIPENKKPLILSVDDINYYPYMIQNGNVYKLIIDSNGKIATYSKDPSGKEVFSEENEIVPLLNHFVEVHPDFSLNGAKGILALTGYEGVLGYRTNELNSPNYPREKKEAMKIIERLKLDGWEFASHGYGHLDTKKIGLQTLKNDTNRWLKEVSPLIGKTDIYIYPFGSSVLPNDVKFQYLESLGFKIFCSVGPYPYLKYNNDYAMMDRVHVDGIGLETQQRILNRFFESDRIIDPERFKYNMK